MQTLERTPLYPRHVELGARLVPFAGWEMPVQYEGVIPEHRAVRTDCGVFDVSHMGELEVEGPRARELLQGLLSNDRLGLADAPAFTFAPGEIGGVECMVNRTGYTGERGVELLVEADDAVRLWDAVLERGATPCGLGARDTLRLEVCYPLHGNDITPDTDAISAGLGWCCALDKEHDWARIDGDEAMLGITWFAQDALGELVHYEPPSEGDTISKDSAYGEVESVKAVSDLIAPLSGEIVAVNQKVVDEPETVNDDPYGDGWLVRIRLTESSEVDSLLDVEAYKQLLEQQ